MGAGEKEGAQSGGGYDFEVGEQSIQRRRQTRHRRKLERVLDGVAEGGEGGARDGGEGDARRRRRLQAQRGQRQEELHQLGGEQEGDRREAERSVAAVAARARGVAALAGFGQKRVRAGQQRHSHEREGLRIGDRAAAAGQQWRRQRRVVVQGAADGQLRRGGSITQHAVTARLGRRKQVGGYDYATRSARVRADPHCWAAREGTRERR